MCVVIGLSAGCMLWLGLSAGCMLWLGLSAGCMLWLGLSAGPGCMLWLGLSAGCMLWLGLSAGSMLWLGLSAGCMLWLGLSAGCMLWWDCQLAVCCDWPVSWLYVVIGLSAGSLLCFYNFHLRPVTALFYGIVVTCKFNLKVKISICLFSPPE